MKQAKRKKSAAAPEQSVDVPVADESLLPDAEYVEQLLAASAPVVAKASADRADADATGAPQAAVEVACTALSLPAQCLLRDAVEYRQDLLSSLPTRTVTVDVAAVERIDAAFMQVLLAFVRSRPSDVEPVQWLNVNCVFAESVRLLGLQDALALPAAA